MKNFNDFEKWKAAVLAAGGKVRKTTVTKKYVHYLAIKGSSSIGFFNNNQDPKSHPHGGSLD